MKVLLIINPFSRGGKSKLLAEKSIKYLKDRNFNFDCVFLEKFEDAYHISAQANREQYETIIAVGGDGTINKIINGFYDNNGNRLSDANFGVIYTGTSPDFCKSYHIPIDIFNSCEAIIQHKIRSIPVGMIKYNSSLNYNKSVSFDMTSYFVCCANIGLGASLATKANSGIRKKIGDFLGTLVSLVQILIKYKGTDYDVIIDGISKTIRNVFNISVGITNNIASGIKVNAKLERDYRELYFLTASNIRLARIPKLLKQVYGKNEFHNSSILTLDYSKKIVINNNQIHPEIEFDGDAAGFLPCSIEIVADKLNIIIS